jgi:hypothetical protein
MAAAWPEAYFMTTAAVWLRVSTGHQASGNQVLDFEAFAAHHGLAIAARYDVDGA